MRHSMIGVGILSTALLALASAQSVMRLSAVRANPVVMLLTGHAHRGVVGYWRPGHLGRPGRACRQWWRPRANFAWRRFVPTVLCALVLASSTLTAAAQPEVTPPLTIDSLSNAAYLSILLDPPGSSHLVQLTDGNYPSDSLPEAPTFDTDGLAVSLHGFGGSSNLSATGDLNGDGAQDIAAVFVEAQSGQNDFLFVVEAYLNQNGQPVPTAAIKVGDRTTALTSLDIQSDLITLTGRRMGSNDAMCCPSQPFTQVLRLQGNQLVDAASPTAQGDSGPAATTPAPSSPNLSALSEFPGNVLVLPLDEPPYASWSFQGVQVYRGLSYAEAVGGPQQGIGGDRLSIDGSVGGPPSNPDNDLKPTCQVVTPYCYYPPFGQSNGTEIFNALKARGNDAFALHKTFPDERWSLWWFDKNSNTSYTLSFIGPNVITVFEPLNTFGKSNVAAAQKLAAMANQLVAWSGS